ncbi:MAG: Gfo/Idh/MocA family oxidoreductase [Lentisphaerae bacterium]|jgi:predicted dehydrogenase|nr:Gfo/Idh/MocA family oxidoreductase [Lentisphaerota bacterium]
MKKLALLGAAHIHTPGFVKRLLDRKDVQVKSVWDHDSERAAKNAAALNNAAVASEPSAIWNDSDIDAVIICSETNRHADLVNGSAAAGKHMFVEKPLGFSGTDAQVMAKAIRQAGVIFQTGYFMRGMPIYQFLRQKLQEGLFGKVTRIRLSNCHAGSLRGYFDSDWSWMADPAIAGCGAFGDLGTHVLDLLLWWCGTPERVTADTAVATGRYGQCDECGEGLLRFPDGCIASLAAGWVDVADPVKVLISGVEGHACVIGNQLYLTSAKLEGADGVTAWTDLPPALPHAFELFLDALNGKKVPLVTPEEAALRSVVMDAMYQAAKKKQWVNVPASCEK